MSQRKLHLAQVEQSGLSQVIRLPRAVHLNCKEVYVQKSQKNLLFIPVSTNAVSDVDKFFSSPDKCSADFMVGRDQGEIQHRDLF